MLRIARKSVVWYNGIARHQTPGQQWSEASSNRTLAARRRCRHVEIPELGKSDGQCSHRSDNLHPQTASCDLRVHSIRHRHTGLEIFAAWQLLRFFAGQAHEELALASFFSGAAPPCCEHDLYQTRKAQRSRALHLEKNVSV